MQIAFLRSAFHVQSLFSLYGGIFYARVVNLLDATDSSNSNRYYYETDR